MGAFYLPKENKLLLSHVIVVFNYERGKLFRTLPETKDEVCPTQRSKTILVRGFRSERQSCNHLFSDEVTPGRVFPTLGTRNQPSAERSEIGMNDHTLIHRYRG
jgi:hypothetical protein